MTSLCLKGPFFGLEEPYIGLRGPSLSLGDPLAQELLTIPLGPSGYEFCFGSKFKYIFFMNFDPFKNSRRNPLTFYFGMGLP